MVGRPEEHCGVFKDVLLGHLGHDLVHSIRRTVSRPTPKRPLCDRGGRAVAILTLVTNKPYLGGQRHAWDPMLLGALLIGVALFLHRWFSKGPGEIRHGFTAQRLSGKDKRWMTAVSVAFGLASPHTTTVNPETSGPAARFGGGDFGGGGAASDF